jgi:hypothetical protein
MNVGFIGPLEHYGKPQMSRVRNVNMQLKCYTSYCRENERVPFSANNSNCNILVVVGGGGAIFKIKASNAYKRYRTRF